MILVLVFAVCWIPHMTCNSTVITASWNLNTTQILQTSNITKSTILIQTSDAIEETLIPSTSVFNISSTTTVQLIQTTVDPRCVGKDTWDVNIYEDATECLTRACSEAKANLFELYIMCNSHDRPDETQFIAGRLLDYLLLRAEKIYEANQHFLESIIKEQLIGEKHFLAEFGYIRKDFLKMAEPLVFTFGDGYGINFPPTQLNEKENMFVFAIFKELTRADTPIKYVPYFSPVAEAVKKLDGESTVIFEKVNYKINSHFITLAFTEQLATPSDYVDMTIMLHNFHETKNHKCAHLRGRLGEGRWSNGDCHIFSDNLQSITCRCKAIVGTFVILSEEDKHIPVEDGLKRDSLTTIAIAVGAVGAIVCLLPILYPYFAGCSDIGGMIRIYRYSDWTFVIMCAIFIFGVYNVEHVSTSRRVAALLHFLHHANMMWTIMEGVHVYHGMNPLYSDVTGMMFFYSTLVFGVAAATAGSAAGYAFDFGGKTQYIWAFAKGSAMMYFLLPTIIIVLVLILFDTLLVFELMSWIGSKQDYIYARAVKFLKRSTGYMFVLACINVTGVMSMADGGSGGMVYFFLAFLLIQAICLFYFHFVSNYEVSEWKRKKEIEANSNKRINDYENNEEDIESSFDYEHSRPQTPNSTAGSQVALVGRTSRQSNSLSKVAIKNSAEKQNENPPVQDSEDNKNGRVQSPATSTNDDNLPLV